MPKLIVDNDKKKKRLVMYSWSLKSFTHQRVLTTHRKRLFRREIILMFLLNIVAENEIEIESVKKLLTASLKGKSKQKQLDLT